MSLLSVQKGSYCQDNLTNLIYRRCGALSGQWTVFTDADSVAYQVPSGKTLYIIRVFGYSDGSGAAILILYGDNAVSGSGSAPTNSVYVTRRLFLGTATLRYEFNVWLPIPSLKYPHLCCITSGSNISISGILV